MISEMEKQQPPLLPGNNVKEPNISNNATIIAVLAIIISVLGGALFFQISLKEAGKDGASQAEQTKQELLQLVGQGKSDSPTPSQNQNFLNPGATQQDPQAQQQPTPQPVVQKPSTPSVDINKDLTILDQIDVSTIENDYGDEALIEL